MCVMNAIFKEMLQGFLRKKKIRTYAASQVAAGKP